MAMEQSAAFSAGMSFTPSPVMATVCPAAFRASTSARLRWGVTRPSTAQDSAAPASSSSLRVATSTHLSASTRPTRAAMADTVRGSSPEISLTWTPWSAK